MRGASAMQQHKALVLTLSDCRMLNATELDIFKNALISVLGRGITLDMITVSQPRTQNGRRLLQV